MKQTRLKDPKEILLIFSILVMGLYSAITEPWYPPRTPNNWWICSGATLQVLLNVEGLPMWEMNLRSVILQEIVMSSWNSLLLVTVLTWKRFLFWRVVIRNILVPSYKVIINLFFNGNRPIVILFNIEKQLKSDTLMVQHCFLSWFFSGRFAKFN